MRVNASRLLVATVLATALIACADTTPLCSQGAGLAASAQLDAATEKYAEASQRGEGDCAKAGLSAAGASYVEAYTNVARGKAAEAGRQVEEATSAYQAALNLDANNADARDGLARLGKPTPEPGPPPSAAAASDTPPPGAPPSDVPPSATPSTTLPPDTSSFAAPGLLVGLAFAAIALLVAGLVLTLWAERHRRRDSDAALLAAQRGADEASTELDRDRASATQARQVLDQIQETVGALKRDLRQSTTQQATEFQRSTERDAAESERCAEREATAMAAVHTTRDQVLARLGRHSDEIVQRCAVLERQLDEVIDFIGDAVRDQARSTHDRFAHPEG